jgi:uncharacterized membrane protein YoaK (UPF0700 family)
MSVRDTEVEDMTSSQSGQPPLTASGPGRAARVPSIDESLALTLIPFVLSLVAGSLDVTGFLGLDGLFTAHITGNLVVLAARLVAHEPSPVSYAISVPVFVAMLALTRLFVAGLDRFSVASLLPLLTLQFLLLLMTLGICIAAGPRADPHGQALILAGMLAVSGMAVQNALVRVSLTGAPSTAVMTTNVSVFTMDIGEILFGQSASGRARARVRAQRTWPAIAGFLVGCALGALCEPAFGRAAFVVPTLLSLGAIGFALAGFPEKDHAPIMSTGDPT